MRCNDRVLLSPRERATVARILAEVRPRIGLVKVFGSRATGLARPASDLDLVIFPPAPPKELNGLRAEFDDSDLPIEVDVLAWDDIDHPSLRDAILLEGVPFFDEPSS